MGILTRVVCVLAWIMSPSALAAAGYDVADLWWNPNESGWGMQMVQQNTTVFATIYVYDELRIPMWYSATLQFAGLNANNGPIYTGTLYETRGPHWASPVYSPPAQITPVGSLTFSSPNTSTGVLTYTIDGVTVTKNVQRQVLVYENFNGVYTGVYKIARTGCTNPAYNGTDTFLTTFTVNQSNAAMSIKAAVADGYSTFSCTFSGTYTPQGSIGTYSATYACTTGETGTVTFAEMGVERFAIVGRVSSGRNNLGCSLSGRFAAVD
jgi:hypothetical protein